MPDDYHYHLMPDDYHNRWGDVGRRYAEGAPAPAADAVGVDEVRWGDATPLELFVGTGTVAEAAALDRVAFFSPEVPVAQVNKAAERNWKMICAFDWPNPAELLQITGEGAGNAMTLHAVFRFRYGLGAMHSEFLVEPPPYNSTAGVPFNGIPINYFSRQTVPFMGYVPGAASGVTIGGGLVLGDPEQFRFTNVGKLAPVRSMITLDIPTANVAVSAYLYAEAFALPDGPLPEPRTVHASVLMGMAPYTRGSKL